MHLKSLHELWMAGSHRARTSVQIHSTWLLQEHFKVTEARKATWWDSIGVSFTFDLPPALNLILNNRHSRSCKFENILLVRSNVKKLISIKSEKLHLSGGVFKNMFSGSHLPPNNRKNKKGKGGIIENLGL